VFTQIRESGLSDSETNIVFQGDHVFAIMNAFPYSPGHVLVLPKREIPDLENLNPEEQTELWSVVRDAVTAVRTAFRPEGINVGVNLGKAAGGSIPQHLHVHIVPRWLGDSNFMTSVANTRTLPLALSDTADRIRSSWPVDK
jgi:ATP adenylyltransferase